MTLHYAYAVPCEQVARIFGVSGRAVRRWYDIFKSSGDVKPATRAQRETRSPEMLSFVSSYVKQHPCFYVEKLQKQLRQHYGDECKGLSASIILRMLRFDLYLSRKVVERRAREAVPFEVATYLSKMRSFYTSPEQLLFLDETLENGLDSMRRRAWSQRGTKAVVSVPFVRGQRILILAACDVRDFAAWETTRGTFTRHSFHSAFVRKVINLLNPWPLSRSIVVMDNARIHIYAELEEAIHRCGAILIFLPPYSPQLNPIEVMFSQLKR